MKKKPLLLQVLGDTLFFLPHLFDTPIAWSRKFSVIFTYLRLTISLFLFAPLKKIDHEKALSFSIRFFDFRTFHLLFRAVFIRNDYFFETETRNPLFLDGGANIGFATLYFKWLYPESEIHAFEPEPLTFELLKKNISDNGLMNVICHPAAILDMDGEADFYFDKTRPGAIQMSLLPRNFVDTVKVRTVSLSTYIREVIGDREIDFLKLDLEGMEMKAMQDLSSSGRLRQARKIFIEFHHRLENAPSGFADFLKILEDNGYEYNVDTYYMNRYLENKFQCINVFAVRRSFP